jgi:hypothetical protein
MREFRALTIFRRFAVSDPNPSLSVFLTLEIEFEFLGFVDKERVFTR